MGDSAETPTHHAPRRGWVRRHPWWTGLILLSLLAALVLMVPVAYVMQQAPLTPVIGNLKKQQTDHPSVLLTSDGVGTRRLARPTASGCRWRTSRRTWCRR